MQVFPFRMTDANLAARQERPRSGFWTDLKAGYDLFEQNHIPPVVSVCNGRYVFEKGTIETVGQKIESRCPSAFAARGLRSAVADSGQK